VGGSNGMVNENKKGPWGGGPGDGGDGDDEGAGPRSPWGQPPRRRRTPVAGNISSLDEFLKKSRDRFGGHFPQHGGRPYWVYGLVAFAALWIIFTSMHRIGPQERGVVTMLGSYSRTLGPGIGLTLPAPFERVQKLDVAAIRVIDVPEGDPNAENLILTGDENIIDLAYSVRWKIRDPEQYLFQIADQEETIREVAESAMRAVLARVSLDEAIGAGRSDIEQRVEMLMQQVLDRYGAGISVQGVAIKQSDPPAAVNEAFKEVSAAQQDAQSSVNQANTYALQITAQAQGGAGAFDKVYAQYKLAPEVTRRRMYYETMERVLSKVDKTIIEAPGVVPYLPLPNPAATQGASR
jgi:membrane protease subunit HflK